jgi:hypothetical protein
MTQGQLRQFFRQKTKAASDGVDWEGKRAVYVRAVDNLYKTITEKYLAGAIQRDKTVTVSYVDRVITEDFIGEYAVRDLVLQVGDERVILSPKGANIVGAVGRIDLRGERGDKTIILQPRERWSVVASREPVLKVVPLSEKSLLAALKDVMRA